MFPDVASFWHTCKTMIVLDVMSALSDREQCSATVNATFCFKQDFPTASSKDLRTGFPKGGRNMLRSFWRKGGGNFFGDSVSLQCS